MVRLYSKLDLSAYKALGLKPPAKQAKLASGQHLADTVASVCLGGRTYLRALGLSVDDLTPCDMSVCGATIQLWSFLQVQMQVTSLPNK